MAKRGHLLGPVSKKEQELHNTPVQVVQRIYYIVFKEPE